ncbi:MAG TPA: mannose-1-phosphate guanylyltransferase [Bacillota bacterium]|nr:mannose-1-phosphate guanylyltransferase [Bacillota bacterium]
MVITEDGVIMNYAVIMCGGSGSRFWPESRKIYPKQFLNTVGEKTMIQLTVDRISRFIPMKNTYMVTNRNYVNTIKKQVPQILEENLIIEPMIKETAACIGYSAVKLLKADPEAVMIVLPSDHYIQGEERFIDTLKQGLDIAVFNNCLVTMGIKPVRPETAYGYIETGKKIDWLEIPTYKIKRFTEKPNKEKAREFIDKGTYLWNSGMFIWKASVLLKQYKKFLPEMYQCLKRISDYIGYPEEAKVVEEEYGKIDGISIDYGILEKALNVFVIESSFFWDDIGNWSALERYMPKDGNGNSLKGECKVLDTHNCILYGSKKLIAAIGVEDLIIVETDDVILVCRKDRDQDIKLLIKELQKDKDSIKYV